MILYIIGYCTVLLKIPTPVIVMETFRRFIERDWRLISVKYAISLLKKKKKVVT